MASFRDRQYESSRPYGNYESYGDTRQRAAASSISAASAQVDFTAPVIHFGTNREAAPRQSLKEQHFVRAQDDKPATSLVPMSKQSKLLTLYIGNLPEEFTDYWVERILKSSAKLQGWKRALDGTGRALSFGFATYDDPEYLLRASSILTDLRLPISKGSDELTQLMVRQDAISEAFVEDCQAAKSQKSNDAKERNNRSSAIGQVDKVLKDFNNPHFRLPIEGHVSNMTTSQKAILPNDRSDSNAVTIMLSIEDELGDIPEEQRNNIAKEITSFRERSAKRDKERARQIADLESRRLEYERANRIQSTRKGIHENVIEAVALIRGPPRPVPDFASGSLSEQAIAERYAAQQARTAEALYADEIGVWSSREAMRLTAYEQENVKQEEESKQNVLDKAYQLERLAHFDDDKDVHRVSELYYSDHSAWVKVRGATRAREIDYDNDTEVRDQPLISQSSEKTVPSRSDVATTGRADGGTLRLVLEKLPDELKRSQDFGTSTSAEDDQDEPEKARTLVPLTYDNDRADIAVYDFNSKLADSRTAIDEIPVAKDKLWQYKVRWDLMHPGMLEQLRVFIAKKIVDVLGMEEPDLIAAIMAIVEAQGSGSDVEDELRAAIGDDEDSELIAVKIWRYLLIMLNTAI